MTRSISIFIIAIALISASVTAQTRHRVMCYNVENLFDPFDDTLTRDEEFTPQGSRHWTWNKMENKLNNIYRVVMAVGELEPPALIGLCEIENFFVLHRLTTKTPLSKYEYRIVHRESPDSRGIDVALLYRPDLFKLQEKQFIALKFPDNPNRKTREILYARGLLGGDTLHVFMNHWPSKYGGELESLPGRMVAGYTLRSKIDSIRIFYPNARILVMGDMNDEPEAPPTAEALGACLTETEPCPSNLVNMSAILKANGQYSYKYQGAWGIIDQIIVSRSLLSGEHKLHTTSKNAGVFSAPFLLEPDNSFTGSKPYRTFVGYKYNGGFSDHLPVFIDLIER